MSRTAELPPDVSGWKAQNLRLTSFPITSQIAAEQTWWHDVIGAERENLTQSRTERLEQGPVDGRSVSLVIDPLRLQWMVSPTIGTIDQVPEDFPAIGSFLEQQESFKEIAHRWLPMSPPIKRIAFGGTLLLPVGDRSEGYRLLDRYLRCVEVDERSSDFLYRINRPTSCRSLPAGPMINRVSNWSVAKIVIRMRASFPSDELEEPQTIGHAERHACALEFDMNTAPTNGANPLPGDRLEMLFDELIEAATQIATRGDER